MRRQQQMLKVEKFYLNGITNQVEIANALGVTPACISQWTKEIQQEWLKVDQENVVAQRALRSRQFDNIAQMALTSFERSCQHEEELTTTEKYCVKCGGECIVKVTDEKTKESKWARCPTCNGRGKEVIEVTKRKSRPGNPIFLSVATAALRESCKVIGLTSIATRLGRVVEETRTIGGELHQRTEELYVEADMDTIIRAKAALDELRAKIANGEAQVVDGKVIEAKRIENNGKDATSTAGG